MQAMLKMKKIDIAIFGQRWVRVSMNINLIN